MSDFDSRPGTYAHILVVRNLLNVAIRELMLRAEQHDLAKLESPEVEAFDRMAPSLGAAEYNSDAYNEAKAGLGAALLHHYAIYDHHPEHDPRGTQAMNLFSLLEMLIDWLGSTRRVANGDIRGSIETNQARFGYGDELKQILLNTLPLLEQE